MQYEQRYGGGKCCIMPEASLVRSSKFLPMVSSHECTPICRRDAGDLGTIKRGKILICYLDFTFDSCSLMTCPPDFASEKSLWRHIKVRGAKLDKT